MTTSAGRTGSCLCLAADAANAIRRFPSEGDGGSFLGSGLGGCRSGDRALTSGLDRWYATALLELSTARVSPIAGCETGKPATARERPTMAFRAFIARLLEGVERC